MKDAELKDKVQRIRKEGRVKVQSKAEALELITYAHMVYGYWFQIGDHNSVYCIVVDENN